MFDKPILCIDSDNFYFNDIINQWDGKNVIFTFKDKNQDPKFSYIIEENNIVKNIIEKKKISNDACTGAYGFESYYQLRDYCDKIIKNNILQHDEYYTSNVIKYMIILHLEI